MMSADNISLSLNEVDAAARKAARGTGYDWGLSEDAGRAVALLCGWGLPGIEALLNLLKGVDGSVQSFAAQGSDDRMRGAEGTLCPLQLGVAICDRARVQKAGFLKAEAVISPLLVFPFVHWTAGIAKRDARLQWAGGVFHSNGTLVQAVGDRVVPDTSVDLEIHFSGHNNPTDPQAAPVRPGRATCQSEDWDLLNAFAARTYAPATEASRNKGAGGDLDDAP